MLPKGDDPKPSLVLILTPNKPYSLCGIIKASGNPFQGFHMGNLLSPPGSTNLSRRRSSVMFNDVVLLHEDQTTLQTTHNVCSSEKMTQTGEGDLWPDDDPQAKITPMTNQVIKYFTHLPQYKVSNVRLNPFDTLTVKYVQ